MVVKVSNAAGYNKNGKISPLVLKNFGFDRVVVGSVTFEPRSGKPKPAMKRYSNTGSAVNWLGLPSEGAEKISENLFNYGYHSVPLTINLIPSPEKEGDDALTDLEKTVQIFRNVPYVDRFELNISCPNIQNHKKNDLGLMLEILEKNSYKNIDLYVKVSPDSSEEEVELTLEILKDYRVKGIVTTNTTKVHDNKYLPEILNKGGASGNALYESSLRTQRIYYEKMLEEGLDFSIIAVGGINSRQRLEERLSYGAQEIQIYTPVLFSGLKMISELKTDKL